MLSNAYYILAKFRFDTAENEPAKNLQKFANFPDRANLKQRRTGGLGRRCEGAVHRRCPIMPVHSRVATGIEACFLFGCAAATRSSQTAVLPALS